MASNHTNVRAGRGEVAFSSTTTDSPILPIEQIERLHAIAPDRVGWVFEQTEAESEHRRIENRRINTMVFAERMASLIFALLIAMLGLGVCTYLAINNKEATASVVGGATLVGLVAVFVTGRNKTPKT